MYIYIFFQYLCIIRQIMLTKTQDLSSTVYKLISLMTLNQQVLLLCKNHNPHPIQDLHKIILSTFVTIHWVIDGGRVGDVSVGGGRVHQTPRGLGVGEPVSHAGRGVVHRQAVAIALTPVWPQPPPQGTSVALHWGLFRGQPR